MPTTALLVRPHYSGQRWQPLPYLAAGAQEFAALLKRCAVEVVELPTDRVGELVTALQTEAERGEESDGLVVYVGGHGIVSSRRHFTALDRSPPTDPRTTDAVWSGQIAELVSGRTRPVLLILDSCFAGEGAADAAAEAVRMLAEAPHGSAFGVLASCRAYQASEDGRFLEELVALVREGPIDDVHRWGPGDRWIRTGALIAELHAAGFEVFDVLTFGASEVRLFPNPGWNAEEPEDRVDIKTRLRLLSRGAEVHLLDKSARFRGRQATRREIVSWLASARSGVFVVTGGPGTGKSALMGLLARQSVGDDSAFAVDGAAIPRGTFDVIVHARQKTLEGIRRELEPALDEPRPTVMVDALDEAVQGEAPAIAAYIAYLARAQSTRFVVGTRPTPAVATGPEGIDLLLQELAPRVIRNLEDDPDTHLDIAAAVTTDLIQTPGSPYTRLDQRHLNLLAREVALHTAPSFLFAEALTRWLCGQVLNDTVIDHVGVGVVDHEVRRTT